MSLGTDRADELDERGYRQLVEQLDMPLLVHVDGDVHFATAAVARLLRLPGPNDLRGRSLLDIIHPEDRAVLAEEMARVAAGEASGRRRYRVVAADGATVWVDAAATPFVLDGRAATLVVAEDVSERVAADAQLRKLALHDALTGLANRTLVADRVRQAVERGPTAVVMIDLDRFKEINDSLGHCVGDAVLVEVAKRIRRVVRADDTVGRVGGDEFVLVLQAGSGVLDASTTVRRIIEAIEAPITVGTNRFRLSGSVGVAFAPDHGTTSNELLRSADAAMYRSKRDRSGPAVFDQRDHDRGRERLRLSSELAAAIDAGQLVLHQQPILDLASGRIDGCEALVRWQHPERGLLLPEHFLPAAEETGLVHAVTRWVVDAALAQAASWSAAGRALRVAVNLSPSSLREPDFVPMVDDALVRHDVGADVLVLEVTEEAVLADPDAALRAMELLAERGVTFSLDDFGTGCSSLTSLRLLPVSQVKIDRSFIGDTRDEVDREFVETIVAVCRRLGLRVVAEGIETAAAAEYLRDVGCHLGQGFHLGRPVPASELTLDRPSGGLGAVRLAG